MMETDSIFKNFDPKGPCLYLRAPTLLLLSGVGERHPGGGAGRSTSVGGDKGRSYHEGRAFGQFRWSTETGVTEKFCFYFGFRATPCNSDVMSPRAG